jgi:hypothetical protein
MPKTEAELLQQFEKTIADMRELANGLLKPKNPANLQYIEQRLFRLTKIVRKSPEQAEAVLWCADAMWHLLYETAHGGVGVQHRRDGLPHVVEDADTINLALDQARIDHPEIINITKLRKKVCAGLGIGRSTLLQKTKYDPFKK